VALPDHSAYRVAYDLMSRISALETSTKDRHYFLNLYAMCRKVVIDGSRPKGAMADP
jgi:hypothetical protein